jgi:hypothetical protein
MKMINVLIVAVIAFVFSLCYAFFKWGWKCGFAHSQNLPLENKSLENEWKNRNTDWGR